MFKSLEQELKELEDSGKGARVYMLTKEQFEALKNKIRKGTNN